nr:premnaspirodiene oxygenase-like [Ipomoea batatas]
MNNSPNGKYRIFWDKNGSGLFSVSSAYQVARGDSSHMRKTNVGWKFGNRRVEEEGKKQRESAAAGAMEASYHWELAPLEQLIPASPPRPCRFSEKGRTDGHQDTALQSYGLHVFSLRGSLETNAQNKYDGAVQHQTCRVFSGREELLELFEEMFNLLGAFEFADVFPSLKFLHGLCGNKNRLLEVHRKVDPILDSIIKEHEKNLDSGELLGGEGESESESEDIIHALIKLKRNGGYQLPITHDTIKGIILDIFIGATETSSSTVVWAMSEMMKNPGVLAKAQAEVRGKEKLEENDSIVDQLPYLKSVVKETLRCHIPGPFLIPRECREETVVGGYTIPVKARVLINAWALARDPKYWENPDSFIPERFDNNSIDFMGNHFEFLPFGSGRRMCPGLALGLVNTVAPLAHMLYHFDWNFIPGITADTLDMTEMVGIAASKSKDLFLIPTPVVN